MDIEMTLGAEDGILRNLPLDPDSLVWIVGAFKGKTARIFERRFNPWMVAFDPQQHAIDNLRALQNPKLTVVEAGLSDRTGYFPMREVGNDACSFFALDGGRDMGEGATIDVAELIERWAWPVPGLSIIRWWLPGREIAAADAEPCNCKPSPLLHQPTCFKSMAYDRAGRIALALFNCEGGEFPAIQRLIEAGALERFDRLMVQFHLTGQPPDAWARLRLCISRTHRTVWDDGPSWVYFERRER